MLRDVNKRLAEKEVSIELSDAALQFVIDRGYDPTYGARPLKRFLQKNVETEAAKIILGGEVSRGDVIYMDVENGKLAGRVKRG